MSLLDNLVKVIADDRNLYEILSKTEANLEMMFKAKYDVDIYSISHTQLNKLNKKDLVNDILF